MTTREHRFTVTDTPHLTIRMPVGDVRVVEGAPDEVVVQLDGKEAALSRFIVEQRGGDIFVEPERSSLGWRSTVALTLRVGSPAVLHARLTAADLSCSVPLAALTVETASGDVSAEDIEGDVEIRSASGDVRLGDIGGRMDVSAASGDVRAGRVRGAVSAKTASGDVLLGAAEGDVTAKSASGDVSLGEFTGSRLDVKSLSGDTSVGVTSGRRFDVAFQSLSGEVRTEFPVSEGASTGGTARLAVKSVSGDIHIHAAK
jgi:DUF4097 and DUF4098 domain-containing protein YvlB